MPERFIPQAKVHIIAPVTDCLGFMPNVTDDSYSIVTNISYSTVTDVSLSKVTGVSSTVSDQCQLFHYK